MALGVKEAGCWCAVVALVIYSNTLDCGLVFDDEPAIKWNKDLRPGSSWGQLFLHDFWGNVISSPISHKSYRPLCVATFRLNYMLHGLQPMGYHLVNVLLHAVVCYLYVQLCALVFTQVWPAFLAGLLFAVHPIHTEAVAGVVGRAELLSAILFLAAIYTYRKSLSQNTSGQKSWLLLSVSIALSVCAMLSKEQGITALAVCLIYDLFIFTKPKANLQGQKLGFSLSWPVTAYSKEFLVRGIVVVASVLVTTVMRLMVSNGAPSESLFTQAVNPPLGQKIPYRQLSWLHLLFVNAWLLLSPSQLSVDWRYGAVPLVNSLLDWNNLYTLVCIAVLVAVGMVGFLQHGRSNRAVVLGVSLMLFPFLPASNLLFPVGFVVAERVLYLPSMGFCMLIAYGAWQLLEKTSRHHTISIVLKMFLGYTVLMYGMKTMSRNREWYSADSLNQAGVQFNPNNPVLLSNLGIERAMQRQYSQAELLYLSSMEQTPSFSGGYYNYGMLMKLLHRYQEAEEPLMRAIELGARDAPEGRLAERYDLLASVIAMNSSRLNEALELSHYVLSQHPTYTPIYSTHCSLLIKLNRTDEFIRACELAVLRNPTLSDTHYNLGVAYMKLGYLSRAEMSFRNMLVVSDSSSTHVVGLSHLATVLQATGQTQSLLEARQLWLQVLQREPQNTEALMSLASVAVSLHHYAQAQDALEAVLAVDPAHKEAMYKAGQLSYQRGLYEEAVTMLSRLTSIDDSYLDSTALLRKARGRLTDHSNRHQHITFNNTN